MTSGRSGVPRQLQTLFSLGTVGALTDGELLERFASRRDAAAEAAFAALVERHGPVVLRVCRDILRNPDDAEDAFQATFLVLVRRAGSIRNRDSVASWLYGVALRVAACARTSASRRQVHERKVAERAPGLVGDECGDDLQAMLHEEVGRLPEKYRAAVVLCYWEGLTHEQAADRLRWPVGTVRSRLSWARKRLQSRLTRRGLAPAVVMALGASSASAGAAPPAALVECTVRGALQLAAGQVPEGVVSASVWALTEGVIRTMMLAKWKMTGLVLLTVGITAAGAGGLALQESDKPQQSVTTKAEPAGIVSSSRKPDVDKEIEALKAYLQDLQAKVEQRQKDWLEMAEKALSSGSTLPNAAPNRISVDEYKRVREQLFQTSMDLIDTEALLRIRQAEIDARTAGVDPELLIQKRIEVELRNDPRVVDFLSQVEAAKRKLELTTYRTRSPNDPARKQAQQLLESLKLKFRELCDVKRDELARRFGGEAQSLHDLKAQIEAMKVRKSSYEQLLGKIEVTNRQQGSDSVKMALIREDLSSLRSMQESVMKRIEQLQYDAWKAARER